MSSLKVRGLLVLRLARLRLAIKSNNRSYLFPWLRFVSALWAVLSVSFRHFHSLNKHKQAWTTRLGWSESFLQKLKYFLNRDRRRVFTRAPDGAQMQDKWRNTDLNVCLYWPDFLAVTLYPIDFWSFLPKNAFFDILAVLRLDLGRISFNLVENGFATRQLALLATRIAFYDILARA